MRIIFCQDASVWTAGALVLIAIGQAPAQLATARAPASDSSNKDGWVLNESVSDEFEDGRLDTEKWFVQGTDGVYLSKFIGRAPSQFSTHNVRIEDGKLKLTAKWEPDFDFSKKIDFSHQANKEGTAFENITTAAVISKKKVHYGYLEIKCKAAGGSVTSSFWMTGSKAELDIFEFMAQPKQSGKTHLEKEFWSSIHDWSKPGGPTTWTDKLQLDWKVADGFHVYGMEWGKDYLKFFADGEQIRSVTREEVGDEGWVISNPLKVWVDSETFPWHGIPTKEDLPQDYEIEYIRIWQKPHDGGSAERFWSFEEPTNVAGKEVDWWIAPDSAKNFSVVSEKVASGEKSLKFTQEKSPDKKVTAFAPPGALHLKAGEFTFSMKVWLEPGCVIERLYVTFQDPWLQLKPFDLTSVAKGKWVTLKQKFRRRDSSGEEDRPRIVVDPADSPNKPSTFYIDDISIE